MREVNAVVVEKLEDQEIWSFRIDVHYRSFEEAYAAQLSVMELVRGKQSTEVRTQVEEKVPASANRAPPEEYNKAVEKVVTPVQEKPVTRAPTLPTSVTAETIKKASVQAPPKQVEEPSKGFLNGHKIPGPIADARDFVPIVSFLRAQGYDGVDEITTVCLSTFRDEVLLLDQTPDEFMKELVTQAMVDLGMIAPKTPPATAAKPEALAFDVKNSELQASATLRQALQYLYKHAFPAGPPSIEDLTALALKLHDEVPIIKGCDPVGLPQRVKIVFPVLAGPAPLAR